MTDLYQAYGSVDEEDMFQPGQGNQSNKSKKLKMPEEEDEEKYNNNQASLSNTSQSANNISEKFELPKQYAEVPQNSEPRKYYNNARYSYSFWDRMIAKRKEVIKLAMFSFVIVLGIALDRIFNYYIAKYISDNVFSDMQELMLRFAYPVFVFLFLWIVKSL